MSSSRQQQHYQKRILHRKQRTQKPWQKQRVQTRIGTGNTNGRSVGKMSVPGKRAGKMMPAMAIMTGALFNSYGMSKLGYMESKAYTSWTTFQRRRQHLPLTTCLQPTHTFFYLMYTLGPVSLSWPCQKGDPW